MHKSVQDFLRIAQPETYFETTRGRFIFMERTHDELGYEIFWKVLGRRWEFIPVFKILGETSV